MSDEFQPLIGRLAIVYGPARKDDDGSLAEYYRELSRLVASYSAAEQDKAADMIIRNHKGKSWPDVPALLTACADARKMLEITNHAHKPERLWTQDKSWTEERYVLADDLCRTSPVGAQARREGWLQGLHEFIRAQGRVPTGGEIQRIKDTSDFVARWAYGTPEVGIMKDEVQAGYRKLAGTIMDKRKKLEARLFGETA